MTPSPWSVCIERVGITTPSASLRRWRFGEFFYCMGFPGGSADKESTCSVGGLGLIPGEGKGYPLQYSGLEKSMDCIVHGVAKSQNTRLSDFHFL